MIKEKIILDLQKYLLKLRKNAYKLANSKRIDTTQIIKTEIRKGYLDGKFVDRLVVFFKGTGCNYVKKSGGCTFCGFYNATNFNKKISDSSYLKQFKKVIEQDLQQYPIVCIYNDGSMFCEDEISFNVLKKVLKRLENIPSIKKVVLESRIADLKEKKIIELRNIFSKQLEIPVGFETANPIIRDFCINKSFSNETFEKILSFCQLYSVNIIPLMLFKPPFLTEKEAIDDYVNSLKYLDQFNLKRIDIEILTIQKDTLAFQLWKKKLFTAPWFWSIIETLKNKHKENLKTPIYVSPISYSVSSECSPSNCNQCDPLILDCFNKYNESGKISVFDDLTCNCYKQWQAEIQKKPNIESIPLRISSFLKKE